MRENERERGELINLIRLIEDFNSNNLYRKPRCHVVSVQEYRCHRHFIVEIEDEVFKPEMSCCNVHWNQSGMH
jgi:hypothetical protein